VVDQYGGPPGTRLETQNARTRWPAAETRSTRASQDSAERHSARTKRKVEELNLTRGSGARI
jgi:hypothetical protein